MSELASLPRVSVIVPAFNAGDDLERCLGAIGCLDTPVDECIVVDDASTDESVRAAADRHGARALRMPRRSGPAAARNAGAAEARGDILLFVDADVLLHADALGRALDEFARHPDAVAVFGSYDDAPEFPSFLSQYRNLYHHWNHQNGNAEASTFWSGCGAIRREAFEAVGGFSADYETPSIEDVELGYRLRARGFRIRLIRDMQAKHLKRWTFASMVKTDLLLRAVPWVVLLRRFPDVPPDLNLNREARIAAMSSGLLALSLLVLLPAHAAAIVPFLAMLAVCLGCAAVAGRAPMARSRTERGLVPAVLLLLGLPTAAWLALPDSLAVVPILLAALVAWTQRGFLRLLVKLRGPVFALGAVPPLLLFFLSCAVAVPLGVAWPGLAGRSAKARPRG